MTDEGQKAIEAAAIAICEHVGFKWDSITKEARENYCAIARKSNSAYLAALPGWQYMPKHWLHGTCTQCTNGLNQTGGGYDTVIDCPHCTGTGIEPAPPAPGLED